MSDVRKPITMLMDEFKQKFTDLLNSADLPAWVILYLLEPYMRQLQQFDEASRAQDKEDYERAVREAEKQEGVDG